jgi:hypothetical protein
MGSPLGPLFANIFMDEFEKKHMETLKTMGVKEWMRYVDDVFAIIDKKESSKKILAYLNNQHPNIRFTIEDEKHNKIPFLDTSVNKTNLGFSTTLYHKPTFTGVYLNWTSLTSRKYKISLIYCLCDRIWKICKNTEDRELEFRKLKVTLLKNEYPEKIIDMEIEKFKSNRNQSDQTNNNEQETPSTSPPPEPAPVEKQKKYIVLPYSNQKVDEFAERLTKLVNNNFDNVDLKIAFKAPNEIGKMFPFKDNISDTHQRALVVYKITCETCKECYIGKTERILTHRIKEHNSEKSKIMSAIQVHKKERPNHIIDAQNIEIIDKADTNFKLMLKEMLHINKLKPSLNTQHAAAYKKQKGKDMFISQLKTIIIARRS